MPRQKKNRKKPEKESPARTNPIDQALTFVAKRFVKAGGTKLLITVFPYLIFGYFGNKMAYAYRITDAPDFFNKLLGSMSNLGVAFKTILPSLHPMDVLFGAVFGVIMRLVVYFRSKNSKKFRKGYIDISKYDKRIMASLIEKAEVFKGDVLQVTWKHQDEYENLLKLTS